MEAHAYEEPKYSKPTPASLYKRKSHVVGLLGCIYFQDASSLSPLHTELAYLSHS